MISKKLRILRQKSPDSKPYWEDFDYTEADDGATVASALSTLPIRWDNSCLQKKCGACAMVVNSRPVLACDTFLKDIKGAVVTIEPLKKFPVIEDLMVDRAVMMDNLKELSVWLRNDAASGKEETAYLASRCLQCGLCLEVCPNFYSEGRFKGMAGAAPLSRLISQSAGSDAADILSSYRKGIYSGCAKSLACKNVCPAGVEPDDLLVKSNVAAVFGRWK